MTGPMNSASGGEAAVPGQLCDSTATAGEELTPEFPPDPDAWRLEVAARLARYRTRRKPRSPHYPSLLLPFDASDHWSRPAAAAPTQALASAAAPENSLDYETSGASGEASSAAMIASDLDEARPSQQLDLDAEASAGPPSGSVVDPLGRKVIEFPRSAAIPVFAPSALADPIFDRPRIVEAPEVVPPPPALGGILIEPVQQEPVDRRATAADCLIQIASIPRRLVAAAVDGLILVTSLCAFGTVFWRLNPVRGPLLLLAGVAGGVVVLLWMAYQFLFVVYAGSTPGLRAARLRFAKFDGSPVNRKTRRWRVLTSFLSGFSAGLGYVWCFLDQDSLCWHDRITRTYIQKVRPAE